eukprot:TRINITY_DN13248_c0_g1_i1.p1 TRINITY_DN13248_c0_g1~~TRINITY_DN13248_c0_g1_i1.p1  ORF type:complete len:151 (+),score=27.00 TRINITY_DN13248_c0_g1_i1:329-781(+)
MIFPVVVFFVWQEFAALTGSTEQIIMLVFVQVLVAACMASLLTSCFILVGNSVTRQVMGTANGISQALSSLFRGIGPSLFGWLFGISFQNEQDNGSGSYFFNRYLPFYILGILACVSVLVSLLMPPEYNHPQAKHLRRSTKHYIHTVQEL